MIINNLIQLILSNDTKNIKLVETILNKNPIISNEFYNYLWKNIDKLIDIYVTTPSIKIKSNLMDNYRQYLNNIDDQTAFDVFKVMISKYYYELPQDNDKLLKYLYFLRMQNNTFYNESILEILSPKIEKINPGIFSYENYYILLHPYKISDEYHKKFIKEPYNDRIRIDNMFLPKLIKFKKEYCL